MEARQEQFEDVHEQFLVWTDHLRLAARCLPSLSPAEREKLRVELLEFLHAQVEPHMFVDEHVLYPSASARLGSPLATAGIAYDHLAIRDWIAKLAEKDGEDAAGLQEILYGLDALIRVHLWKEDELLVRPLGSATWPASGA
jgi:iron-sulfur cluster repair protein YtfE (RIC family)